MPVFVFLGFLAAISLIAATSVAPTARGRRVLVPVAIGVGGFGIGAASSLTYLFRELWPDGLEGVTPLMLALKTLGIFLAVLVPFGIAACILLKRQ